MNFDAYLPRSERVRRAHYRALGLSRPVTNPIMPASRRAAIVARTGPVLVQEAVTLWHATRTNRSRVLAALADMDAAHA